MKKGTTAAVVALTAGLIGGAALLAQGREAGMRVPRGVVFDRVLDRDGSVIGATVRNPQKDELAKAKLSQQAGAWIERVLPEGPAAKAGLAAGDLVVEFDGERVRSARHFSRLVEETPSGRAVKATVLRESARHTLDITPMADRRPGDLVMPDVAREIERGLRSLPPNFELPVPSLGVAIGGRGRLGAHVEPLGDQLADYFGVKSGVLVMSVTADSPAAKAGLKAGDVITAIDGKDVADPSALSEQLRAAKPGQDVEIGIVRDRKAASLKATMPEPLTRRLTQRGRAI
jgi:serine protease Do